MIIVSCAEMRQMEKESMAAGISSLRLMENAGSAAARFIRENMQVSGKRCLVLCGCGNNGGDGFVVARRLYESNAQVIVVLTAGVPRTPEASEMFERINSLRITVIDASQDERCAAAIMKSDIVVDAIYGTGFHGEVEDPVVAGLIDTVNKSPATVFALDMPSGANADTGKASKSCVKADFTVTFGAPKTGQYLYPASNYCGKVVSVGIGMPESVYNSCESRVELLEKSMIADMLPRREKNSNKGTYGKVLCLCGSLGMAGAAYLAASGALRCGAGLVTLGVPQPVYLPIASKLNECMVYPLDATKGGAIAYSSLERISGLAKTATVMLIGCGLSRDEETQRVVWELVSKADCPIILDADGINAFEGHINLLRTSKNELILTPHPGEMARLCGKSIDEIQHNRLEVAREFATENGVTLVLKGANTIVAAKDGRVFINPTGNPGMAKGGSGDILAGMIASFAAQKIAPEKAACCGVFIHGSAGDRAAEKLSKYGMIPTDMLMEVPQIFREMQR